MTTLKAMPMSTAMASSMTLPPTMKSRNPLSFRISPAARPEIAAPGGNGSGRGAGESVAATQPVDAEEHVSPCLQQLAQRLGCGGP